MSSPPPPAAPALRRLLNLAFGLAVAVGGTAGTGVLFSPTELARALPSARLGLVLWLLGGVYTLLGANALAELAGRRPQAGGWYGYARAAFQTEFVAVAVAWADWTSSCVTGALVALWAGQYAAALLPGTAAAFGAAGAPRLVALALVGLVAAAQWRSPQSGGRVQEITAAALVLAVLALLAGSLALPAVAAPAVAPAASAAWTFAGLVGAAQAVIFAYDGWYGPIYFAEEVPEPGRALPRALLGGTAAVVVLYALLQAGLGRALPFAALRESELPLAELAAQLLGPPGRALLLGGAVVFLAGVLNSVLLMATRVLFALGRGGQLPAWLAQVHPAGTPRRALGVAAGLTLSLALSGTAAALEAVTSILFVAYYAVGYLALLRLRRREALPPGAFRAWGQPLSLYLVLALSGAFLLASALADWPHALAAAGLVAGGALAQAWRRRAGGAPS